MEHLLEMRNLSIDLYKGKKAPAVKLVEGIDLMLEKRQNFGVVGESGCGKSITCSSIMGLLSFPLSVGAGSSIRFQREDGSVSELTSLPKAEMRKIRGKEISMIFQEPMTALDPMYTIEEQIQETLRFHTDMNRAQMHDAALEMLNRVKIPRAAEILKDYPHHLSGGMLQRVMIAIALINNPRLLIADEPTTALDVTIQAQILDLLRRLRDEEGMSVVLISHDLGVVASLCDRVEVMYGGMALESGLVDDIFERPRHPYTSALLGAVPNPNERRTDRLVSIPGTPPSLVEPPDACPFADRCKFAADVCRTMVPEWRNYPTGQIARCAFDADALGLVGVGQGGEPCVCCGAKAGNAKDDESAKEA